MGNLDFDTVIKTSRRLTEMEIDEMQRIARASGASYVDITPLGEEDNQINYSVRVSYTKSPRIAA